MTSTQTNPTLMQKVRPFLTLHPQKLRNVELNLLIMAMLISASAIVLVQLGTEIPFDVSTLMLAAFPAVIVLIIHIVMRFQAPDADPFILPIITTLNGIGAAVIYRIDLYKGYTGWQADSVRQLVWTAIAASVALIIITLLKNHKLLQRYTYISLIGAVILLILPAIPGIGRTINGATLWINLGFATFQPGEVAKILLAIFFAGYLVQKRDALTTAGTKILGFQFPRARDMGPILVAWLASIGVLVLQKDLGTSLLYFGLFLVMLYSATGKFSWVFIGVGLFAVGAVLAAQTLSYVAWRFNGWLNAFDQSVYEASGGSYQLVQGLFGLAKGGIIGTGLGEGRPYLIPLAESDYIIASIGEELGLIGLFAVLVLFLLFVSRGFKIGFAGQDDFGKLLAVGLSFVVAIQCFIVIGGVTRVIPVTGLATPFLAAGGSALVANWAIAAILIRISDSIRNQPKLVIG